MIVHVAAAKLSGKYVVAQIHTLATALSGTLLAYVMGLPVAGALVCRVLASTLRILAMPRLQDRNALVHPPGLLIPLLRTQILLVGHGTSADRSTL